MDVSIIFVNYKTKDLTINAINSVIEKTEGINYEIFVVDNNSQDGSVDAIEKTFPNINIIKNNVNAGFGVANNLAIKQAKGKYILCLNTDTLLINNAIKIMFDFMEQKENSNVGACGGYIYDSDMKPGACGGHFPNLMEVVWKFGLRNIFKRQYHKYAVSYTSDKCIDENDIDIIIGANIFFRKNVLREVGVFDEDFFMFWEEADLCKRIKNYNYNIKICKDAKIQHLEGKSCIDNLSRKKNEIKGFFLYIKKNNIKQYYIFKILYLLLYLFDGFIFNHTKSRKLIRYILFDIDSGSCVNE